MATYRYSIGPNEPVESIVAATGAAVVTKPIEITVDLGNVKATGNPSQQLVKSEVLLALERAADFIQKNNWPPA